LKQDLDRKKESPASKGPQKRRPFEKKGEAEGKKKRTHKKDRSKKTSAAESGKKGDVGKLLPANIEKKGKGRGKKRCSARKEGNQKDGQSERGGREEKGISFTLQKRRPEKKKRVHQFKGAVKKNLLKSSRTHLSRKKSTSSVYSIAKN